MKPMLACDYEESELKFPLWAQPKIDGVRALNINGYLVGRSKKVFKNQYTTRRYSMSLFSGFDGEMVAADIKDPALCRKTSSALGTIGGEPSTKWWLFDYVLDGQPPKPYYKRSEDLCRIVRNLQSNDYPGAQHLEIVPTICCYTLQEVDHWHKIWTEAGYEGTILRDPEGLHKQGRSTPAECGLLRIKDFENDEAVVRRVIEGNRNDNELTTSLLGYAERSSHQANMIPNGMVGSFICEDCKTGKEITVAAGRLTRFEREYYFDHQSEVLDKTIIYRSFKKGVKDKPRFPTFQMFKVGV